MWSSKKDKGMTIHPGEDIEINFSAEWKNGKEEVVITTDNDKFVLDGKNELFLEVTSSNAKSIKVQIVPDFKKRTINMVEVIDINADQTTDKNKGRISLVGICSSIDMSRDVPRNISRGVSRNISNNVSNNDIFSIDKYIKTYDENMESFGKRIRRYKTRRNIFIIFSIVVAAGNIYLFTINTYPMRYFNIITTVILMYTSFRLWHAYKDLYATYEKYREQRSKIFETVKNK